MSTMDPYSVIVNWIVSCLREHNNKGNYYNICLQESDSTNTLKLPVLHYNIYHNISSPAITESFDTSVTFDNVSCDTLYLITVNGENIIGEGGNKSISICEFIKSHLIIIIPFRFRYTLCFCNHGHIWYCF